MIIRTKQKYQKFSSKKFSFLKKHIKFADAIKEIASAFAESNNIKSNVMEKQPIHFNPPFGGHLLEDITSNTNNAENEETSRKTATRLNAHANAKNNNLNNKHMKENILFYFTDESTLAAPKSDFWTNFTKDPRDIVDIVNQPEFKLQNMLVVKLKEPTTIKEINCWLNHFQMALKDVGIGAKTALPIPDSINSTVCKTRFHNDNTIDTIRYTMHIFF